MTISIIAAMTWSGRVIGKDNDLPWKKSDMPADMLWFQKHTKGKPIIMGRKTHESIGGILPGRKNIIITRDEKFRVPGRIAIVVRSPEEALKAAGDVDEVMIIGGAEIYEKFLPLADKMYLTLADADLEGDTFFPKYDESEWKEIERQHFNADEENKYPYTFVTLERIKQAA